MGARKRTGIDLLAQGGFTGQRGSGWQKSGRGADQNVPVVAIRASAPYFAGATDLAPGGFRGGKGSGYVPSQMRKR